MKKLKRRDFLKIIGFSVAWPTQLLILKGKESSNDNNIEADITLSYLYDSETDKCRELDLTNPADASMYVLHKHFLCSNSNSKLIDWESFGAWSEYCSKEGLRLSDEDEIYLFDKSKTLLEYLELFSRRGKAIMFWDGRNGGHFEVVYECLNIQQVEF